MWFSVVTINGSGILMEVVYHIAQHILQRKKHGQASSSKNIKNENKNEPKKNIFEKRKKRKVEGNNTKL